MLVLSRKVGEDIVIPGAKIRITVLGMKGTAVRLGITAPRTTPIHRKEIWDRIRRSMDAVVRMESDDAA